MFARNAKEQRIYSFPGLVIEPEIYGTGGIAIVRRGRVGNCPVAVKTGQLKPKYGYTLRDVRETFRTETGMYHILAESPPNQNVLQCFGSGTIPALEDRKTPVPVLILQWAADGTLYRRQSSHSLPLREAVWYLYGATSALEHVHIHGILHLDVKPENFLLNRMRILLSDFGSAAMKGEGERSAHGTPMYLAPERCKAGGVVTEYTDQYSLAIVGYQLLSEGKLPFVPDISEQDNPFGYGNARMRQTMQPLGKNILEPFDQVFERALSIEPGDRYENMIAMRSALEEAYRKSGEQSARSYNIPPAENIDFFSAPTLRRAQWNHLPVSPLDIA